MSVIILSLFIAFTSATPVEKINHLSEVVKDVTSSSAPAYWNAECGGRTYVGSYTLMMDWAECRDYCQYFPHSGELGHSFTFADILDTDTMECLRYNMNQQYTPGNGYAGHYWAGGYRGGDGQYRWDSGEPFTFDDFVGNPGTDPYIHLTPGNNYQWNTKSDQNDRNNGCLCKSEQEEAKHIFESQCPDGWVDHGTKCILLSFTQMDWWSASEHCQTLGSELVSWTEPSGWFPLKFYMLEYCNVLGGNCGLFWTAGNDEETDGEWVWGQGSNSVPMPMDLAWGNNQPSGIFWGQTAYFNNHFGGVLIEARG